MLGGSWCQKKGAGFWQMTICASGSTSYFLTIKSVYRKKSVVRRLLSNVFFVIKNTHLIFG